MPTAQPKVLVELEGMHQAAPAELEEVPAGQDEQVEEEEPEKVPTWHGEQSTDKFDDVPAGHTMHKAADGPEVMQVMQHMTYRHLRPCLCRLRRCRCSIKHTWWHQYQCCTYKPSSLRTWQRS